MPTSEKAKEGGYARLPQTILPQKYHIQYDVLDLMRFRFEGSVKIDLLVQKDSIDTIAFHAAELHIFNVNALLIDESKEKKIEIKNIRNILQDEVIVLELANSLLPNSKVTLRMDFHGILNDQLRGFYRSEYSLNGEQRMMAVTQFEACDARRAFPCWDEPIFKSKFQISITTEPDLTALSNTHVVQTLLRPKANATLRAKTRTDSLNEKIWKFAETPVMSTYLVAMVIGEFDVLSDTTSEGVVINVCTPPGRSERGRFALNTGIRALSHLTNLFQLPYPLRKLDNVAIPDFLGAMENWGLVTYEEILLLDEKEAGKSEKELLARVVCHELSHQWFGNLVTMDWWTGLWLNEGFAQYMECEVVDHLFPDWKIWDTFVFDTMLNGAFARDIMNSSHPIEVEVKHSNEVDEIFDAISYDKGASVVRMLVEFLGRDAFFQGVRDYLKRFSYKNTSTSDLWEALEQASDIPVKIMADTWTKQTGFPVVTLAVTSDGLQLSQDRLQLQGKEGATSLAKWDIPITYRSSECPAKVVRLGIFGSEKGDSGRCTGGKNADRIRAELDAAMKRVLQMENGWIKLNANQAGVYCVQYTSELLTRLKLPIRKRTLPVCERVGLLNEVFTLAECGRIDIVLAFEFVEAYRDESNVLCWKELSAQLTHYLRLMEDAEFIQSFRSFIRGIFKPALDKIGWETPKCNNLTETEREEIAETRRVLIEMLGRVGDQDVIAKAKEQFQEYMDLPSTETSSLDPAIRIAVFQIAIANGGAPEIELFQKRYKQTESVAEQHRYLAAIGANDSPILINNVLQWSIKNLRSRDLPQVFKSSTSSARSANIVWNYIESNWKNLNQKLSPDLIGRVIVRTISKLHTAEDSTKVLEFLAERKDPAYEKRLEQALETIETNTYARTRDLDRIAQWLQRRYRNSLCR